MDQSPAKMLSAPQSQSETPDPGTTERVPSMTAAERLKQAEERYFAKVNAHDKVEIAINDAKKVAEESEPEDAPHVSAKERLENAMNKYLSDVNGGEVVAEDASKKAPRKRKPKGTAEKWWQDAARSRNRVAKSKKSSAGASRTSKPFNGASSRQIHPNLGPPILPALTPYHGASYAPHYPPPMAPQYPAAMPPPSPFLLPPTGTTAFPYNNPQGIFPGYPQGGAAPMAFTPSNPFGEPLPPPHNPPHIPEDNLFGPVTWPASPPMPPIDPALYGPAPAPPTREYGMPPPSQQRPRPGYIGPARNSALNPEGQPHPPS